MKTINPHKYTLTIFGALLLVGAYLISEHSERLLANSVITNGTVVDIKRMPFSDAGAYQVVVEFTAEDGNEFEFAYPIGSEFLSYRRGQVVEVIYPKSSPKVATVMSVIPSKWVGIILASLGVVMLVAGLAITVVGLFNRNKL